MSGRHRRACGVVDRDERADAAHAAVKHHNRPHRAGGDAPQERVAQHAAGGEQAVDAALLQQAGEGRLFLALDMSPEHQSKAALLSAARGGARDCGVQRVRQGWSREKAQRPGLWPWRRPRAAMLG